jgi:hypothetical protein
MRAPNLSIHFCHVETPDDTERAVWEGFTNGVAVREVSDGTQAIVAPPLNRRTTP